MASKNREIGKDVTGFVSDPALKIEASNAIISLALAICMHTKDMNEAQGLIDNIAAGLRLIVKTKLAKYQ